MDTFDTWWKGQKIWWKKARRKAGAKITSIFDDVSLFSGSSATGAGTSQGAQAHTSSPLKTLFGYGSSEPEPAPPPKPPPTLNKTDVAAALVTYFPHASIVVLCQEDGTICTSENYVAGGTSEDELGNLVRAVNVGVSDEARDKAITDGLLFAGKRFEVFQFHPPLVYGRTAVPKQPIKDGWGIVVVRHELSDHRTCILGDDGSAGIDQGRTVYLIAAYPLPNTSAYILAQAKSFIGKYL